MGIPSKTTSSSESRGRFFLTRKYPFPQSSNRLRDCAVYSAIVFLILYLLQPFGFSVYSGNKFIVSLIFGAITFGCCYLYALAIQPLQKKVSPWRVWHEALSVLIMTLFVCICNIIVFSIIFHYSISVELFLLFLYWTFAISFFITIISVGMNYHRYLRSQLETLLDKTTEVQTDIIVTIHDVSVRGNDLQLPINDLLYVEAQKNNVLVRYMKDNDINTTELHTTLTAVLDDLKEYENIFQCHRSFVVNLNNITSAQGNSNGYQLMLGKCPAIVPVSRTYVPKLRSFIA